MATPNVVPMFDPNGEVRMIPMDQVSAATESGGRRAIPMSDPSGTVRYIPHELMQDALAHGGKLVPVPSQPTKFEQGRDPSQQEGGAMSYLHEGLEIARGVGQMGTGVMPDITGIPMRAAQISDNIQNRQDQRRSKAYQATALATDTVLPVVNARKMEDQADVGNWKGIVGTAAADITPVVVGAARAQFTKAASPVTGGAADIISKIRDGNQVNVMPAEIGKLPPKIVNATENIFRAAAPTGMNKGFRANLYAAVPDLADIGRAVNLEEAKGGIINPDMRVRATVDAVRDHLDNMYQTERAPQIQRNADLPVDVGRNPNAQRGLEFLETTAGDVADSALATKALQGKTLSVAEADKLAQLANQTLKSYEKMTPEGKMQIQTTSPKIGGIKALDQELSQNLNKTLQAQGEKGLWGYERRYAALSAIRDQLESRMNAVELDQPGIIKGIVKPIAGALKGGPSGIASASQAAVADVNIGRILQKGLRDLADSDLTSK